MSINNVVSERNMGKKSEIEMKVNSQQLLALATALNKDSFELRQRLDRLECKWDALIRRLEGLDRHPEDEGWFD